VSQTHWTLLSPGQRYTFSVWLRADKPSRANIGLCAQGSPPEPGEKTLERQGRAWIEVGPDWKRYTVGVAIPRAGQYVRLWCVVQHYAPGVVLSVDHAELVLENPAPAPVTSLHPTHSVACVRTDAAPVIDGKLDDPCWQRAGIADDFTNLASAVDPRPSQKTSVYLLHDEDSLYIAYRCFESDLDSVTAEKTVRDAPGLWGDDCVELFLIPPDSAFPGIAIVGPKYYYLLVNSLGTQGDNVGLNKVDQWDGDWLVRSARESDAWTVEMSIPFAELDSGPRQGAPWRVNFPRSEKRLAENSSWSPLDLKFHDPPRFGNMYFVHEPGDAALVIAAAVAAQSEKLTRQWRAALSTTHRGIDALLTLLRQSPRSEVDALAQPLSRARRSVEDALRRIDGLKPREVLDRKDALGADVAAALAEANVLANAADALLRAKDDVPFLIRSAPAITNDRVLPTSLFSGEDPPSELSLAACPGEYEPVSFLVVPSRDIAGLTVTCSELRSPNDRIPASAVDVKLVKCWYQAFGEPWTGGVSFQRGKVLLPELLLNDDRLVRVDLERKRNFLRVTDPKTGQQRYEDVTGKNDALTEDLLIRDAAALLPVDGPAGHARQFYVTVHVPDTAAAGTYQGDFTIRCEGAAPALLPIRLTVHPFKLAPSIVEQSIYYRGQLTGYDVPVIDLGNRKTETQYEAEMRDMVAHGVDAPLCYQPPGGPEGMKLMKRVLAIRKEAGVRTDRFFFCAWGVGPKDVNDSTRRVLGEMKALTRSFGYREFYNYGPDEPSAERMRKQIEPWRFLRDEIRVQVYLACNSFTDSTGALRNDLWSQVKDVVSAFVVGGTPDPELAALMHDAGMRIYNYANPQCGIEEPLTYRRNYGLLLWKAGYDGAMDYAYQHGFGPHMWNDFDSTDLKNPYRDHVMAYATSTGVVDTLQWEGYREGVDDLRYLSTLLATIEKAKNDPARADAARKAETWLQTIDPAGDLDRVRARIVEHILNLSPASP